MKERPGLVAIAGAAAGVLGTVLAGQLLTGERIDRVEADRLVQNYYRLAVDPEQNENAWEWLVAPDLQAREPDGYASFRKFWSHWRSVELGELEPLEGTQDGFHAQIAYVNQAGDQQSWRTLVFYIECDSFWENRIPGWECDMEDLRLRDAYRPEGRHLNK